MFGNDPEAFLRNGVRVAREEPAAVGQGPIVSLGVFGVQISPIPDDMPAEAFGEIATGESFHGERSADKFSGAESLHANGQKDSQSGLLKIFWLRHLGEDCVAIFDFHFGFLVWIFCTEKFFGAVFLVQPCKFRCKEKVQIFLKRLL
jgi:hypothetical protein